jgi:hypothetical protein
MEIRTIIKEKKNKETQVVDGGKKKKPDPLLKNMKAMLPPIKENKQYVEPSGSMFKKFEIQPGCQLKEKGQTKAAPEVEKGPH